MVNSRKGREDSCAVVKLVKIFAIIGQSPRRSQSQGILLRLRLGDGW